MPLDRSAPGVRIELLEHERAVAGELLDLRGRIVSFRYEDHDERADICSIELDNFDLSLFDRSELAGGSVFRVTWGYPTVMSPARGVLLRRLKGFSRLTLECHGLSVLHDRVARTRRFESRTSSEVVREVARELGYDDAFVEVEETTERHEIIAQHGETDARFLARLAAREGFAFRADEAGLRWQRPPREVPPSHVLTYYTDGGQGSVLDVSVESDLSRRAGSVSVRGRDPRTRQTIEGRANNESVDRTALAEVVEVVDPETGRTAVEERAGTSSVRTTSAPTQEEAQREASARFRRAEERAVRLKLTVVGDPTLTARRIIEVRGISRLLSGRYYVRAATHAITGEGYTTELTLQRDGVGRLARRLARPHGGQPSQATEPGPASEEAARRTRVVERVDAEDGQSELEYRDEIGGDVA